MKKIIQENNLEIDQNLNKILVLIANINKNHKEYNSIIQSINNFVEIEFSKIKQKKILPNEEWAKFIFN